MRRALIAGNWKMNGLIAEGMKLAEELAMRLERAREVGEPPPPSCDLLVCPPFTLLALLRDMLAGRGIALGAQDCASEAAGAFTGDISAAMLADIGCDYVILGHSERRHHHREDDALVRRKAEAANAAGLTPIVCVGETEEERGAGRALEVIARQVRGSLPAGAAASGLVIAYEPVWAIGTGKTATPADAVEAHREIRRVAAELLGASAAVGLRILYGGSVKPDNARELLAGEGIDGALVGGASLKAGDFWAIAASCP